MKKYVSGSVVSIVIKYNGGDKKVRFMGDTYGGGYYMTDDAEEVRGLESHWGFGELFLLDKGFEQEEEHRRNSEVCGVPMVSDSEVVLVTSLTECRNYLRDQYGIPSGRLRTKEQVREVAEEYNVTFEGVEL